MEAKMIKIEKEDKLIVNERTYIPKDAPSDWKQLYDVRKSVYESIAEQQEHFLKDKKGKVIDTNNKFYRTFNYRKSTMKFNRCCDNCKYCNKELITDTNFLPYTTYTCLALPDQTHGNNFIEYDYICNNYIKKGTQK